MDRVKVPGYGRDGSYVELAKGVEIRHQSGNPESTGPDWEPSRWELWDDNELIWCADYGGFANPWDADPKEATRRTIEEFAALYSLGKQNAKNQLQSEIVNDDWCHHDDGE